MFAFLQSMQRQEQIDLVDSSTFQSQGRYKHIKHEKKDEILVFKPLLQEIQLKNLTIRTFF